jgi:hypothetical protein
MEQSWNNARAKTLHFPASQPKHCSIDLEIFFRAAHLLPQKVVNNTESRCRFPSPPNDCLVEQIVRSTQ